MEWIKTHAPGAASPRNGILAILAGVFLLSFSDALVKLAGAGFSLAQLILIRSFFAGCLLAALMAVTRRPWTLFFDVSPRVWLRSLSLAAMWLCYYAALPLMSFALAAACYYTAPVWIALLSHLTGAERIGWLRAGGIAVALGGVVLALNPAGSSLGIEVLLPLAAAFFYALAAIITRHGCARENPLAMALNLNIVLLGLSLLGLIVLALLPLGDRGFTTGIWPQLDTRQWILAACLGGLLAIIAALVAYAYSSASASIIGVFDNCYLVFAALWSLTLFGTPPSGTEMAGLALIAIGAALASIKPRLLAKLTRFPAKHRALAGQTPVIAGERAGLSKRPVARDHKGNRVATDRRSHRT